MEGRERSTHTQSVETGEARGEGLVVGLAGFSWSTLENSVPNEVTIRMDMDVPLCLPQVWAVIIKYHRLGGLSTKDLYL